MQLESLDLLNRTKTLFKIQSDQNTVEIFNRCFVPNELHPFWAVILLWKKILTQNFKIL